MPIEDIPHLKELIGAFRTLETPDETRRFLDDLCTYAELAAMAQRYYVASRLDEGAVYHVISSESGASTATISRVGRALKHGAGGYKIALERTK